jgi:pimeloyl-ACP methyl ester carboxylesterase
MEKMRTIFTVFLFGLILMATSCSLKKDSSDFSMDKPGDGITYQYVGVNGIELYVAFAGPPEGEPVILLHGYPDASFAWREQMAALAGENFYVIAPNQRGYNLSDKPEGVDSYRMDLLVSDIIGLADGLGFEKFNLAGHDFGGIVSWNLVDAYPERVKRLVIFNCPHPLVMKQFQDDNEEQKKKSWYAYAFKIPVLPEIMVRAFNWRMLTNVMKDSFSEEELDEYRRSWSQPGASKAMINWYRALFRLEEDELPRNIIDVPTLVVWGKQDPHVMWQQAEPSAAMSSNGRVEYIEDATHWVLHDAPEKTSELLVDFFNAPI